MAQDKIDWNSVNLDDLDFDALESAIESTDVRDQGKKVARIVDVPAKIVAMAQDSRDRRKVVSKTFPTVAIAAHVAELLKSAGPHTNPPSGMWVPYEEGSKTVTFSAGEPRGRKTKDGNGTDDGTEPTEPTEPTE